MFKNFDLNGFCVAISDSDNVSLFVQIARLFDLRNKCKHNHAEQREQFLVCSCDETYVNYGRDSVFGYERFTANKLIKSDLVLLSAYIDAGLPLDGVIAFFPNEGRTPFAKPISESIKSHGESIKTEKVSVLYSPIMDEQRVAGFYKGVMYTKGYYQTDLGEVFNLLDVDAAGELPFKGVAVRSGELKSFPQANQIQQAGHAYDMSSIVGDSNLYESYKQFCGAFRKKPMTQGEFMADEQFVESFKSTLDKLGVKPYGD